MSTQEQERAEFEAWMREGDAWEPAWTNWDPESVCYVDPATEAMWSAWQAARAAQPAAGAEELQRRNDIQADTIRDLLKRLEDAGKWPAARAADGLPELPEPDEYDDIMGEHRSDEQVRSIQRQAFELGRQQAVPQECVTRKSAVDAINYVWMCATDDRCDEAIAMLAAPKGTE